MVLSHVLRYLCKGRGKFFKVLGNVAVSSPKARPALMVLLHLCSRLDKQYDLALHQTMVSRGRTQSPRHLPDHRSNRSVYSWREQ